MKKILLLAILSACATIPTTPVEQVPPANVIKPSDVVALACASKCAQKEWGVEDTSSQRGRIPRAATAGIALTFARAVCEIAKPSNALVAQASRGVTEDAIHYLNGVYKQHGLSNASPGKDILRHVYAAMFSFAAMESSGQWCEGRDTSADNYDSETSEAGMFQTSYNSRAAHSELGKLYQTYKDQGKSCFFDTFSNGVSCSASKLKNWGTGEGVKFQKLSKECPAFATEYAALMFRYNRSHYYPLNQAGKPSRYAEKWIEPTADCDNMLQEVQQMVEASPALCEALK